MGSFEITAGISTVNVVMRKIVAVASVKSRRCFRIKPWALTRYTSLSLVTRGPQHCVRVTERERERDRERERERETAKT